MVPWEDLQTRGIQFADDRYLYFSLKHSGSEMAQVIIFLLKCGKTSYFFSTYISVLV